ncbi:glycosyltransferase family 2 protein [Kamptonema formosum]|uniref:glycosyltransferase family 2 protein n=1 Tax=Kamptonema formosum TaxID=331992 RepID=UPI00034530B6|nr:glycosyltransferase family A protein [Oscillatoria sp. PCC 10802]
MMTLNYDLSPEISIILCTYNRAKYLNDCIDSAINQTFQNWELLVVDDGSQDNTFEIVNSYIQKFKNIRYIKHQNRKQGFSRNVGIQASLGKYITFIDSDDTYKVNHLESRHAYMQSNPDVDLISGGLFSEEEFYCTDYFQPDRIINIRDCVMGPTFFGKREVFFELNGYSDLSYGEDTDFWQRAEKKFKTQKLTEPETYVYTRAETSITKSALDKISSPA